MARKKRNFFQFAFSLLKTTLSEFINDNVIKYCAALAYYTVLSLAPLLLIIISLAGLFFGKAAIQGEIYSQINQFVGNDVALQLQELIKNINLSNHSTLATVFGVVTFLIGASGIFTEIQDSINIIWGFKSKPGTGLKNFILNRLLSFSMIGAIGFLLMVSLFINALISGLSNIIQYYFPGFSIYWLFIINNLLTFASLVVLFATIFKVLPDARVKWRYVRVGAIVTAILFMLGKFLIGFYLANNSFTTIFGAAGSTIIIMIWVYYNATILYFGAEFTQVYARATGHRIYPKVYSIPVKPQ